VAAGGGAAGGDGRPQTRAIRLGTVTAFDVGRGLGTVADGAGGEWPFHCTAIADGSRTIEVGTAVVFRPVPGHLGRMEAADVQPLASSSLDPGHGGGAG
jgi:cold shock CspA family protein